MNTVERLCPRGDKLSSVLGYKAKQVSDSKPNINRVDEKIRLDPEDSQRLDDLVAALKKKEGRGAITKQAILLEGFRLVMERYEQAGDVPIPERRETAKEEHLRKLMAKDYSELTDIETMIREIVDGYLERATMPEWERKELRDAERRKRGL